MREPSRPLSSWLAWAGLTATMLVPFVFEADSVGPPCLFRLATGRGCPGCGLTRSVFALAHGRVRESLGFHLFGPVAALALVLGWAYLAAALWLGRRPLEWKFRLPPVVILWALFIAYWAVRVVTDAIP